MEKLNTSFSISISISISVRVTVSSSNLYTAKAHLQITVLSILMHQNLLSLDILRDRLNK